MQPWNKTVMYWTLWHCNSSYFRHDKFSDVMQASSLKQKWKLIIVECSYCVVNDKRSPKFKLNWLWMRSHSSTVLKGLEAPQKLLKLTESVITSSWQRIVLGGMFLYCTAWIHLLIHQWSFRCREQDQFQWIPRYCKTDDMFWRRLNSTESDLHAANRNNKHFANVDCVSHVNIYRMHACHYKLYTYQFLIDQQSWFIERFFEKVA